jgi:RNA polymerase sigma factor (sigma-70 family)
MSTIHDDQVLLGRWTKERDAEAFKTLVTRYGGMVYGVCRRVLGNETEAEDASQECFEALSSAGTKPGPYLGAWLHRVAVFQALNRLKIERRRRDRETRLAQTEREPGRIEWNDIYACLDEAVTELPEKNRVALVAYFYANETQETIAARLGVSRQVVAYRINTGIERIRKALKKKGIYIEGAALAALVKANVAEAAPASLVAKLGRVALVGPGTLAPAPLLPSASGAWMVGAKGVAVMAVCALLAGGSWLAYGHFHRPYPTHEITAKSTFAYEPRVEPAPDVPAVAAAAPAEQAEETKTQAASTGVPTIAVYGQVLDENGRPVPGATVTLDNRNEFEYQTKAREEYGFFEAIPLLVEQSQTADGEGRFLFPTVPLEMRGWLAKNIWLKAIVGKKIAQAKFRREIGSRRRFFELVLRPNVGFGGRVVDEAGHAVAGAHVAIVAPGDHSSGRMEVVETGVDGTWRFVDMPEGACELMTVATEGYDTSELRDVATGQKDLVITLSTSRGNYVEGRLVDASGAPVAGIGVAAIIGEEGWAGSSKASDAAGRFRVAGLSAGTYRLSLCKASKAPFVYYIPEPVMVTIAADRPATGIEVNVAEGASVSGRVVNALTGAPFENVDVVLSTPEKPSIKKPGRSDETGAYQVAALPIGEYQVKLHALEWDLEQDGGVISVDAIRRIDHADFQMQPPAMITGAVIDEAGNPVAGASVVVVPTSRRASFGILADSAGKFIVYLQRVFGPVYLQAIGDNCVSPLSGRHRGGDEVTLTVEPAGRIEGQVVDDAGNRVPEGWVTAVPDDSGRFTVVTPTGGGWFPDRDRATGTDIRRTGEFEFDPLLPGFYRLEVFLPGCSREYPVATARAEVRPGQTLRTYLRVSSPGDATVEGMVVFADAPVPNAEVSAWSEGWASSPSTKTDESGHYIITNLPEGATNITVQIPVSNSMPKHLKKSVELVAGEAKNLDFIVAAPNCSVEGIVTQNGEPAPFASVVFEKVGSDASEGTVDAMTDVQGHFHSDELYEGKYQVRVRHYSGWDFQSSSLASIETKTGETVRCDLALRTGTVEGTVTGLQDGEKALIGFFPGDVDLATVPSLGLDIIKKGLIHGTELMPGMPLRLTGVPAGLYYVGVVPADAGANPTPADILAIYLKGRYALVQVEVSEGHTTSLDLTIP